ncbi:hypothetical protein GCM10010378_30260 [Streptomyces viridochromogenes]
MGYQRGMINHALRGLSAAALAFLSCIAVAAPVHAVERMPLADAVAALPVATESREGYSRDEFRHWNSGDLADGCNTRAEVLIHESLAAPAVGPGCRLTGGMWFSYYDSTLVTSASGLDIDHMVPLAEAWDSGASAWSAQRRRAPPGGPQRPPPAPHRDHRCRLSRGYGPARERQAGR